MININEIAGEKYICAVWNNPCVYINLCQSKNRGKILEIINLKNTYSGSNLENTTNTILTNIENIFIKNNLSREEISSCRHYLTNGLGPHFDNTFINCDFNGGEENFILRKYIFNIFKLEKIFQILNSMSSNQIKSFAQFLRIKYNNKLYSGSLSFIINITKNFLKSENI